MSFSIIGIQTMEHRVSSSTMRVMAQSSCIRDKRSLGEHVLTAARKGILLLARLTLDLLASLTLRKIVSSGDMTL